MTTRALDLIGFRCICSFSINWTAAIELFKTCFYYNYFKLILGTECMSWHKKTFVWQKKIESIFYHIFLLIIAYKYKNRKCWSMPLPASCLKSLWCIFATRVILNVSLKRKPHTTYVFYHHKSLTVLLNVYRHMGRVSYQCSNLNQFLVFFVFKIVLHPLSYCQELFLFLVWCMKSLMDCGPHLSVLKTYLTHGKLMSRQDW